MTREEIIAMAREAGIGFTRGWYSCVDEELERFANLVAAAEREECAKAADEAHELMNSSFQGLAAAIRARGEK